MRQLFRVELEDVVGSVFDLVGRTSDPILEEEVINERVNRIFQVKTFEIKISYLSSEQCDQGPIL